MTCSSGSCCSTLLSSLPPAAHQSPSFHGRRLFCAGTKLAQGPAPPPAPTLTVKYPLLSDLLPLCSPSPLPALEEDKEVEDLSSPSTSATEDAVAVVRPSEPSAVDNVSVPPRGCKACGSEEIEKGCNGEGRIQGGIATVPGFGWWPIKAYRPCPGFMASGGRYRRRGQSMDEVAFGRGESEPSALSNDEAQSRKKQKGPRGFKR
ncbi:uncharacterized protein LOC131157010 isoform X2 [Malania oleifera]|uniref:uncharacterized protein LOC131157010 isoform X2 n=1 Tax=Malania oleifera TaxID=397392 RepID=UPI0025AE7CF4|nr:uncharacterized protein LOC131157010 isoform X2 [Malania oleifera]